VTTLCLLLVGEEEVCVQKAHGEDEEKGGGDASVELRQKRSVGSLQDRYDNR
jgi:hypothetical protein